MEAGERPLICIVPASSRVGRAAIEALLTDHASQVRVRAALRSEDKARELRAAWPALDVTPGVDAFDAATHGRAFQGAARALIVAPQLEDRAAAVNALLTSAARAGVAHVALIGGVFQEEEKFLFHRQWMASRRHAGALGLRWTQLECSDFMENLLASLPSIRAAGRIEGAGGGGGASAPVAVRDVGRAAAAVLAVADGRPHFDRGYRIVGPEVLSPADVARAVADVAGRPVEFVDTGVAYARQAAIASGTRARWQADGFYDWVELYFATGRLRGVRSDLPLLGVEPTRLRDWLLERRALFADTAAQDPGPELQTLIPDPEIGEVAAAGNGPSREPALT